MNADLWPYRAFQIESGRWYLVNDDLGFVVGIYETKQEAVAMAEKMLAVEKERK